MENLDGKITLELLGAERELVANFGVVEKLERQVLKRPIIRVLEGAANNNEIYFHEVVEAIMTGLAANRDTRFTRDQIGEYVFKKGLSNFVTFYIEYLAMCLTGTSLEKAQSSDIPADPNKKK